MFECPFLRTKRIDSYQKLGLLLWFDRRDGAAYSLHELADRTFIADLPLLERSLADLIAGGLVDCTAGRYRLIHSPETDYCLGCLAATFESPLARQGLLACVVSHGRGHDARAE